MSTRSKTRKTTTGKRRTRKSRSSQDGIKLLRRTLPSGRVSWNARWKDPRTGKTRSASLDREGCETDADREAWIEKLRDKLALARAATQDERLNKIVRIAPDTQVEAPRTSPIGARETYLDHLRAAGKVRPRTVTSYAESTGLFATWCTDRGIEAMQDLGRLDLKAYEDHLTKRKRRVVVAGKLGAVSKGKRTLSSAAAARYARETRVYLQWLRKRGFVRLSKDEIVEGLESPTVSKADRAQVTPLEPAELRKVLEAALKHDKKQPMSPPSAVVVALLVGTGMRMGEALSLTWDQVDIDPVRPTDPKTKTPVPENIRLLAKKVKTKTARVIPIGTMSPGLVRVLRAWRLRSTGPFVLGGESAWTRGAMHGRFKKLIADYDAPRLNAQLLRQTADSLALFSRVFGGNPANAAKALGHSAAVAWSYYQRDVPAMDTEATTIDGAAGCTELFGRILASVRTPGASESVA